MGAVESKVWRVATAFFLSVGGGVGESVVVGLLDSIEVRDWGF
jgi:hypothetical protein